MDKIRYLQRRRSGIYHFRARIPAPLRLYFGGRREWCKSLKTRSLAEAKSRVSALEKEFKRLCDHYWQSHREEERRRRAALRTIVLDERYADGLIQCLQYRLQRNALRGKVDDPDQLAQAARWLGRAARSGEASAVERLCLRFFEEKLGIRLERTQAGYVDFQRELLHRIYQQIQALAEYWQGRGVLPQVERPQWLLEALQISPGPSLEELHESWVRKAPHRAPKTIAETRRYLEELAAFTGKTDAAAITKGDLQAFIDHLHGTVGNQPKTIRKKLGQIAAVFRHANKRDRLPALPWEALVYPDGDPNHVSRRPFQTNHLNAIFTSSLYTGRGYRKKPAYRWLPWLALFQGARLEELAQLLVDDVFEKDGILCLRIDVTDPTRQRLKNSASRRLLPLHEAVLRAGFPAFVEARRAGHRRLFPELKRGADGRHGSAYSKVFGRILDQLGITERCYVFHSFRHTFEDACRQASLDTGVIDALMGHAPNQGRNYRYGTGYSIEFLKQAIDRICYPGLVTPRLP